MISPDTISRILDAARIEEVIGEFVHLKRRGANMVGLSPFQHEKTPSFTVSPAKQIFKDFSSGKGGNAVTFLMELEHLSYPEALRWLAKKYNIEIEEEGDPEEMQKAASERENLFTVNTFAQKYFSSTLFDSDEGKSVGLSYLRDRGFTDETIRKFQLGYSPEDRHAFTMEAMHQGYNMDYLIKAGLVKSNDRGQYDAYAGRIIFPIHNIAGRVIAFAGRTLKTEKTVPKYINSPETEVYHKSNVLYGLNFAKNAIVKNDLCYLVEGYADLIMLFQSGVENVVASSGTSLTQDQIRLIRRYSSNIVILYDGDPAGIKASFRAIDMIMEEGMNVKVVLFPEGHDPDSYARQVSTDELKAFLQSAARDFISFKAGLLGEESKGDPVKRAALLREVVSTVALIPDAITRMVYIQECSRLLQMEENVLLNEVNKIRGEKLRKQRSAETQGGEYVPPPEHQAVPQPEVQQDDVFLALEKEVIRLMLLYGHESIEFPGVDEEGNEVMYAYHLAELALVDIQSMKLEISDPVLREIFEEYEHMIGKGQLPTMKHFLQHPNPTVQQMAVDLVNSPYEISEAWADKHLIDVKHESEVMNEAIARSIMALRLRHTLKKIEQLQDELKDAPEDDQMLILYRINELQKEKMALSTSMERVIL